MEGDEIARLISELIPLFEAKAESAEKTEFQQIEVCPDTFVTLADVLSILNRRGDLGQAWFDRELLDALMALETGYPKDRAYFCPTLRLSCFLDKRLENNVDICYPERSWMLSFGGTTTNSRSNI